MVASWLLAALPLLVRPGSAAPDLNDMPVREVGAAASGDPILMIGMLESGDEEAAALARVAPVLYTRDSIRCLSGDCPPAARRSTKRLPSFVRSLGLDRDQSELLLRFLQGEAPEDRDDWARIAQLWAPAERGERIPSRLVLSGHSVGVGVYGDDGYLLFDSLRKLARIMPHAAAMIEDVFFAGCSTGSPEMVAKARKIFPNLETYWAYGGVAPSPRTGSIEHLLAWERATRGDARILDRGLAFGTNRGENVVTWSAEGGYQNGAAHRESDRYRRRLAAMDRRLEPHFKGERLLDARRAAREGVPTLLEEYDQLADDLLKHGEHSAEQVGRLEDERYEADLRLEKLESTAPISSRSRSN